MGTKYIEDINDQYSKLLKYMNIPIKSLNDNYFPIFKKIYAIKLLISRPELKIFIVNDYTDAYFNFIIEAFICILRNEKNASSLLLRSAIENFLKLTLETLNLNINNRSFSENHKKLNGFLDETIYIQLTIKSNASTLQRHYSVLSAVSHSYTNLNKQAIFKSFTNSLKTDISKSDTIIKSWNEVLDSTFIIMIMLSSTSIKKWDTDDISNYLKLIMGEKKKNKILKNIK